MLWIVYVLCLASVSGNHWNLYTTDATEDYPDCGANEELTFNKRICPPKSCDILYATYECLDGPPEPGCDCIDGYLRNVTGVCIPKDDCPKVSDLPQCGPNEIATFAKIVCPPQTCESVYTLKKCRDRPPEPGCNCIENYLRNASGVCIPSEQCPPSPILPKCGLNEVPTTDKTICPPQTCESVYIDYTCELRPPEPGCDCIENYLRNASGICIPSHECPPRKPDLPKCGLNEEASENKITCPPQTCASKYSIHHCLPSLPTPGCNCIDGYLRNYSGICIPSEKCPVPVYNITCGPFEIKMDVKTQCPPQTCESLYSINFCEPGVPEPGCDCIDGYLRDDDDVCIPSEECPVPADYVDDGFDEYDYTDIVSPNNDKQVIATDTQTSSKTKSESFAYSNSKSQVSASKSKSSSRTSSFTRSSSEITPRKLSTTYPDYESPDYVDDGFDEYNYTDIVSPNNDKQVIVTDTQTSSKTKSESFAYSNSKSQVSASKSKSSSRSSSFTKSSSEITPRKLSTTYPDYEYNY